VTIFQRGPTPAKPDSGRDDSGGPPAPFSPAQLLAARQRALKDAEEAAQQAQLTADRKAERERAAQQAAALVAGAPPAVHAMAAAKVAVLGAQGALSGGRQPAQWTTILQESLVEAMAAYSRAQEATPGLGSQGWRDSREAVAAAVTVVADVLPPLSGPGADEERTRRLQAAAAALSGVGPEPLAQLVGGYLGEWRKREIAAATAPLRDEIDRLRQELQGAAAAVEIARLLSQTITRPTAGE
jgi:hypothetical protein